MSGLWNSSFIEFFNTKYPHMDLERSSRDNILNVVNVNEYRQRCICGSP